ncbi:MAG: tetratricopeptide repeat protein [Sulfuriferula multivorans]|uniref:Tetratricopeptide repeat protein n=1 Tax=Sulfuriferula multivorans TaxID=1559896 RepID=A0A7C9P8A9_9PROT|nr:tetratricopeptide repeat protein [Sulfuriferula multivorans]
MRQNVLTRSKKSKAAELLRLNRLEEAEALYGVVCRIDAADSEAWLQRAGICRRLGRFQDAEQFCRRALTINPHMAVAHQTLGAALHCQGRVSDALEAYRRAIRLQDDLAETHYLLGNVLRETGDSIGAIDCYRRAVEINPDFVEALCNLGAVLNAREKVQEAVEVLNRAVKLRPDSPQILCNMALVLQGVDRHVEALGKYRQALRLKPDFEDAICQLAALLEKMNQLGEAVEMVERYLPQFPNNHTLLMVAGKLKRRDKQIDAALALFEKAALQPLGSLERGILQKEIGCLYDSKNEPERAFWYWQEGNRLVAEAVAGDFGSGAHYLDRVRRMRSYLPEKCLNEVDVVGVDDDPGDDSPVFLLGFARSGTTLLEQILDSHPLLQTLGEKGTVDAMVKEFEAIVQGRTDPLQSLSVNEIARLREVYFREVSKWVERKAGTLLVDKMPLDTINVHVIWRVFPKARFLLAIRHPCDVCLSCFMQGFRANEAMLSFLTLENTARTYGEVMQVWQAALARLPLNYHRIRYEDLVVNFEPEARALLDFMGVEWHDAVLNHAEHAGKRGSIKTPSYHQVTQPIYQHAKYRWKRYAPHFEPVMPTLQPFIEYFGYAE